MRRAAVLAGALLVWPVGAATAATAPGKAPAPAQEPETKKPAPAKKPAAKAAAPAKKAPAAAEKPETKTPTPTPPAATVSASSIDDGLTPAEAPEVDAESKDLAAERAAEAKAGLAPTPAEIAGSALDDILRLGVVSPLRLRVAGALRPRLGPDLFCPGCPGPQAILGGKTGLDAIDLRVARHLFDIPIVVNDEVRELVDYFTTGPGRPHFARWLDRAGTFMPLITRILRKSHLPKDLVFVSMIESGFATHAYSPAHAVGPWQFIRSTAHTYDLRMDPWVDERRDPVKATEAAGRYLAWLHQQFGSWFLAWAAYNAGPGRVQRAIDQSGTNDYWTLCRRSLLPAETCRYVPKIIAAALLTRFPKAFGFDPPKPDPDAFSFDKVHIKKPTELKAIARAAGASFQAVRTLNPELRLWITPPPAPGEKTYTLRLPAGTRPRFLAHRKELKPARRTVYGRHRIRRGDTLWAIARRYHLRPRTLMEINGIKNVHTLRLGMSLLIPLPYGARPRVPARRARTHARHQRAHRGVYTVVSGDTLWSISQRFGVTTHELCRANHLRDTDNVTLSIGQKLRLPAPATHTVAKAGKKQKIHVLAPGETLWQLSQRYGCSVKDLERWNGIADPTSLKPGQRLVVAD